MTKKEIVRQIADRIHETQLKTKEIVQLTFDAIVETLINDRRIELRNFGVFEVKLRKARKARNPRTEEEVQVPPKFVVTFKPGKEMEERVRDLIPSPEELAALEEKKEKKEKKTVATTASTPVATPAPAPVPTPVPAPMPVPAAADANGDSDAVQPVKKKKPRKAPSA